MDFLSQKIHMIVILRLDMDTLCFSLLSYRLSTGTLIKKEHSYI